MTPARRLALACLEANPAGLSWYGFLAEYGAARGQRVKPRGQAATASMVEELRAAGLLEQRAVWLGQAWQRRLFLTDAGRAVLP